MQLVSSFEARLNSLLGRSGKSDSAIAADLGISKQAISNYRNGLRSPKASIVVQIADYLGVDPVWLLGYDVPPKEAADIDSGFTADERDLIALWRGAEPSAREIAREVLANHQKKAEEKQA